MKNVITNHHVDVQFYILLEYMEKIALTIYPLCTCHQSVVSLD